MSLQTAQSMNLRSVHENGARQHERGELSFDFGKHNRNVVRLILESVAPETLKNETRRDILWEGFFGHCAGQHCILL